MTPSITIALKNKTAAVLHLDSSTNNANVSHPDKVVVPGNGGAIRGFQLSSSAQALSKLNGKNTFFGEEGFPGYLSSSTTEADIVIHAQGAQISYLYITFDTTTGDYAKTIMVNGKAVSNDKVTALVSFSEVNTVMLSFTDWSNPESTIKIMNIALVPTFRLRGGDLISFRCSENLFNSELQITPGICEQYADIKIYDRDSTFRQLILVDQSIDDANVDITVGEYPLGTYTVSDWNFETDNSVVDVTCRDPSYLLDKITVQRAEIADRTLDALLNLLFTRAGTAWVYLDTETRERCQHIIVPNSWFASSSLKVLLEKTCSLGMLRIFWSVSMFYVGRAV